MNITKDIAKCLVLLQSTDNRLGGIEKKLNILKGSEDKKILPLNSIEEIKEFEKKLQHDTDTKEFFIEYLSHIDGKDEKSCVYRSLKKVFGLDVSPNCGWTNRNNNFSIKSLNIVSLVKESVIGFFPSLTDTVFEQAVKDWFRAAHQRQIRASIKS